MIHLIMKPTASSVPELAGSNSGDSSFGSGWKWVLALVPISCILVRHWRSLCKERRARLLEELARLRANRCFDLHEKQHAMNHSRLKMILSLKDAALNENLQAIILEKIVLTDSVLASECNRFSKEEEDLTEEESGY
uniref:Uncharacterized protein n=1 Tax=Spongospora subterranea TaxID=70186 RepID=A0A0H5RAD7_9EUKA|eukprot:CRZ10756.1 hypothetical protein [Spongospora subterranea]